MFHFLLWVSMYATKLKCRTPLCIMGHFYISGWIKKIIQYQYKTTLLGEKKSKINLSVSIIKFSVSYITYVTFIPLQLYRLLHKNIINTILSVMRFRFGSVHHRNKYFSEQSKNVFYWCHVTKRKHSDLICRLKCKVYWSQN